MAKGDFERSTSAANKNLRQSVQAARSLGFELSGASNKAIGMASASAAFAENIAKASRNARVAASATGIGLIVAALGTAVALTIGWKEKTKEVAERVRDIATETKLLEAQGRGDQRLATELHIVSAMEGELREAKKLESAFRKFPQLQDAIRAKADAARRAAADSARRATEEVFADIDDAALGRRAALERQLMPTDTARQQRALGIAELADRRAEQERELQKLASTKAISGDMLDAGLKRVADEYKLGIKVLDKELQDANRSLAQSLGASLVSAIADGIAQGIQQRDLWKGLQAVTGGIIMAIGEMMQEVGTKALLASSLIAKVMALIGTPAGIPAALALIAAGAVVKGIGATIAGTGTAWDPQHGTTTAAGYGGPTGRATYVGVVGSSAPSMVGVTPVAPVNLYATIVGTRDAKAARELQELLDFGQLRAAGA